MLCSIGFVYETGMRRAGDVLHSSAHALNHVASWRTQTKDKDEGSGPHKRWEGQLL